MLRALRRLWWRFINSCLNCGNGSRLPGRTICQPCALTATRFTTRTLHTSSYRRFDE
jgi:hypothetical protein